MVLISKSEKNGCGGILFCLVWNTDHQLEWKWHSSKIVFASFCNWNILSLLTNNSINCSIWVLELTLLKLTQNYSSICLTTYLFLTNLSWFTLVSICFSWQLCGKDRVCSKHITFYLLSRLTKSFDLNKKWGFV